MAQAAEGSLFAQPGKIVAVGKGSRLSLYCTGTGSPTVVLESGFGGGTAATWWRLQPVLSRITRTCSYDRAGYGFSELGSNLPRDLRHAVTDLHGLLQRSGEKGPYLLIGHSNGGLMVGAYADRHPRQVAGLVFLDAAVVLPDGASQTGRRGKYREVTEEGLKRHLAQIRRCMEKPDRACVDPDWYKEFPADVAKAEVANRSLPRYWQAYLSEAECNYRGMISGQAAELLPHKWGRTPVRVVIASISTVSEDPRIRENRARAEARQARVCELAADCRVYRVATTDHLVHNADPALVARIVAELARRPLPE